jgi:hypothetical protein
MVHASPVLILIIIAAFIGANTGDFDGVIVQLGGGVTAF